jgi:hypothetical protein
MRVAIALLLVVTGACAAEPKRQAASNLTPAFQPKMCQPTKLFFADDFSETKLKPQWVALHKTRWSVEDGVFKGIPATEAFQKSRTKHNGGTPSSRLVVPTRNCVIQFRFKITGKMKGLHFGFNDGSSKTGTGHVCRVTYSTKGSSLVKDKNTKQDGDKVETLKTSDWKLKTDTWYTLLIEMHGEKMLAQIKDGPTLYAEHKRFDRDRDQINLPTRGGGNVYYDDVRVWEAGLKPDWKQPAKTSP